MRRILKKVLAIGLIFSLTGCGHYFEGNNIIDNETGSLTGENQSVVQGMEVIAIDDTMPQSSYYLSMGITASTDGYYCVSAKNGYYISYYDIKSGILGEWCSRADCKHTDPSICTARYGEDIYKRWLEVYNGYIYQIKLTDEGAYLMKRNLDGSNLVQISKLWDTNADCTDVEYDGYNGEVLLQGGYIYYIVTQDSENMTLLRSAVDGSVSREVMYEWSKPIAELGYGIKCDSKNLYIYGLYYSDDSDSFIMRYETESGAFEEIYRKSVSGEISGNITHNISSFSVYEGGIYYYSEDAITNFLYDSESKTEKEYQYRYKTGRAIRVSPDAKLFTVNADDGLIILDSEGKELMNINYKESFPEITGYFMLDGIDDRNFVFIVHGSEHGGKYILDRRCVETGILELKMIADR